MDLTGVSPLESARERSPGAEHPGRNRALLVRVHRTLSALAPALALTLAASSAAAAPYTKPAPPMSDYIAKLGFLAPKDPSANLDAITPGLHEQLELFLLEGAEAGAQTGDPVLLAWFAAADTGGIAPWRLTNCGDYNYDVDYDCDVIPWGSHIWQIGLGVQVSDHYGDVAKAFAWAHPNRTAEEVGDEVLQLAAQSKKFPAGVTVAELAAKPGGTNGGMHDSYWIATLERDLAVSAYLEAPPATNWPCYLASAPGWCSWYRQPPQWQGYSDVLSAVIVSWGQILGAWSKDLVPDVIVDDLSSGFSVTGGTTSADGKGGWRGHYTWAAADASGAVTGSWTASLPAAGAWTVSAFLPRGTHAVEKDAQIVVHATDGDHAVTFDESPTGGHFVKLGVYHFDTTATASMTSKASGSTFVGWDALRWHLEKADPPLADAGAGGAESDAGADDAGTDATVDTTARAGAGGPAADSGCSCRAAGAGGSGGLAAFLGLFALGAACVRKRSLPQSPALVRPQRAVARASRT